MIVKERGHKYALDIYDDEANNVRLGLTFVSRVGPNYPGNEVAHPGTNLQEVLRACIDRTKFLNLQQPCIENEEILEHFRECLLLLERRAARKHGRTLKEPLTFVEVEDTCEKCGHIQCGGTCRERTI